jgi:hypothetical protein
VDEEAVGFWLLAVSCWLLAFTQIPQMKADSAEAKEEGSWQFKGKDRPISLAKSAV